MTVSIGALKSIDFFPVLASSLIELVVNLDDAKGKLICSRTSTSSCLNIWILFGGMVFIHMILCQTLVSYIHMGLPDKDALFPYLEKREHAVLW